MRNLFNFLALVAIVAVGVVSCQEVEEEMNLLDTPSGGTTLYVSELSTRVDFTDNEDSTISLSWEEGDIFTLYDSSDTRIDNFECTSVEDRAFTSVNKTTSLTDGEHYYAIYPASEEQTYNDAKATDLTSEQNGDEIDQLDEACYMLGDFTYSSESTKINFTFEHQMAIMTFKFESAVRPAKLIFENGEDSYTVNYSTITADDDNLYTSHIMINPCKAEERTLTFSLYATAGATEAYDIRTVTTSYAYEAGYRYTAPVSELENAVSDYWTYYAAESFVEGAYSESTTSYTIETAEQLAYLAKLVNGGTDMSGVTFTLTADIDLSGHEWVAIGYYTSSSDYNYFKGTFDGGGYEVSGLYINQPSTNYQGLFGVVSAATIKNLGVSGNVTGAVYVGGVVGRCYSSTVENCYNVGSVTGENYVGGVVGYNFASAYNSLVNKCYNTGSIAGTASSTCVGGVIGYNAPSSSDRSALVTNCYNTGAVTSTDTSSTGIGGIVGYNRAAYTDSYAVVANCYNTGGITGGRYNTGGIVGYSYSSASCESAVINCYNMGSVKGSTTSTSYHVGGIVGENGQYAIIDNCYNAGEVYAYGQVGGITGYNNVYTSVSNSYFNSDIYDGDAVGYKGSTGSTITNSFGLSTSAMQGNSFVALLNSGAYTYNNNTPYYETCAWAAVSSDYPAFDADGTPTYTAITSCTAFGAGESESDPYLIFNGEQLRDLSSDVNSGTDYEYEYFEMICDIDLGGESSEFTAIGKSQTASFRGTFNGGDYEVSGLYINQSGSNYQGLFGYISGATIKNLGVSGSVTGKSFVGGVVGCNYSSSTVENCYNSCSVEGSSYYVGGVVGRNDSSSTVENCYNSGTVKGDSNSVGGVVGYNYTSSTVENCYNFGSIEGSDSSVGGVVGCNSSSTVKNCYNSESVMGLSNSVGGVVGYSTSTSSVENCYNTGAVDGAGSSSSNVGGVVGYSDSILRSRAATTRVR